MIAKQKKKKKNSKNAATTCSRHVKTIYNFRSN